MESSHQSAGSNDETALTIVVHTGGVRVATATLSCFGTLASLAHASWLVLSSAPVNPLAFLRSYSALCLAPLLGAALLRRVQSGTVECGPTRIRLVQRAYAREWSRSGGIRVSMWRCPLPGPGVAVEIGGERFGAEIRPVAPLLEALEVGPPQGGWARSRAWVWAQVCERAASGWSATWPVRIVAFSFLVTLPLFRVHQLIAYGGAFGEYRLYGLGAYLSGFAIYWATVLAYLALYAVVVDCLVGGLVWAWVQAAPETALRIHAGMDAIRRVLYFGGVVAALVLRFLPW